MDESASPIDPAGPEPVICPGCAQRLIIEQTGEEQIVQCPTCHTEFLLGSNDEPEELGIPEDVPLEPESELDGQHIRQLVQLRRSTIRSRTYAIIIMLCCLVMGVQLVLTDLQEVHSYGWDRWAILYAISAFAMAVGAAIASRKAGVLHRESKISLASPAEPEYVPQFDALSDGSQRVANLEMMRGEDLSTNEHE